jgi:hypothetical protein
VGIRGYREEERGRRLQEVVGEDVRSPDEHKGKLGDQFHQEDHKWGIGSK